MPMKRLSMRKLKEVLRLRYELGLGQRQIARSCSIGQGTVSGYLKRAQEAGSVGRCRKAGMIADWKPPYSEEPRGAPTRLASRSPTLPNFTNNSDATLT